MRPGIRVVPLMVAREKREEVRQKEKKQNGKNKAKSHEMSHKKSANDKGLTDVIISQSISACCCCCCHC